MFLVLLPLRESVRVQGIRETISTPLHDIEWTHMIPLTRVVSSFVLRPGDCTSCQLSADKVLAAGKPRVCEGRLLRVPQLGGS